MSGLPLSQSVLLIIVSSVLAVCKNEDNGTVPNILDIHVELQPGSTSLDIQNSINDEVYSISKTIHTSTAENVEEEGPIVVRSIEDDILKSNFEANLDKLLSQILTLQNGFRDAQQENRNICVNSKQTDLCLKQRTAIGIYYNNSKILESGKVYPKNCKEVQQSGINVSGIYEIYPRYASAPFAVLCDMETKGGGWTHIQKRFDGSQDFYLGWRDYKFGFGDLEGEFWLGLEKIYLMTDFEQTELLVEIVDRDNISAYAHYTSFAIGPEKNGYTLDRLSGFTGDAGDSLTDHLGQKFSTKDLDFTRSNCASYYLGAWWYKNCHISNLNGKFINVDLPAKYKYKGMHWKTYRSYEYCHSKSRMLIRPIN